MQDIAPGEIVYATITLKDEKNRILGLHEAFKNKNNLISEQDNTTAFDEAKFNLSILNLLIINY